MDKFWDWLKKQEIPIYHICGMIIPWKEYILSGVVSDQVLIGYMLEYIRDHEIWEQPTESVFNKITKADYYREYLPYLKRSLLKVIFSKDHYKALKQIIEEIDK